MSKSRIYTTKKALSIKERAFFYLLKKLFYYWCCHVTKKDPLSGNNAEVRSFGVPVVVTISIPTFCHELVPIGPVIPLMVAIQPHIYAVTKSANGSIPFKYGASTTHSADSLNAVDE